MSADGGSQVLVVPQHCPLLGRRSQLERIAAAVRTLTPEAAVPEGGVLVLRGPRGSGRTRLLDAAVNAAGAQAVASAAGPGRLQVLRVDGVAAESQLEGAAVDRLIRLLGGPLPDRPPSSDGTEASEQARQLALGTAVLDLLERASRKRPLICVLDDADDVDLLSLRVLGFVGRRLGTRAVLLLIAHRAGGGAADPLAGLPSLSLPPLDDADSERVLLARIGPRNSCVPRDDVALTLATLAEGNPLALVELADGLSRAQLNGSAPLPSSLPPGSRLYRHHRDRLDQVAGPGRQVLLLAAAQQPLDVETLLRAMAGAGLDTPALDGVLRAGLLRVEAERVRFVDGLLRGSCYAAASVTERLATHRLLAQALDHDAHRLDATWHRAMSVSGGSEQVELLADELQELAARSADQGAASRCLERAATLTTVSGRARERLVAAARAAWRGGDGRRARHLLDRARAMAGPSRPRDGVDLLLGEIELRSGTAERAYQALSLVSDGLTGPHPQEAVAALLRASEVYMLAGDHARFLSAAHRIAALDRPDEVLQTRLMFEQFAGFAAAFTGAHQQAAERLRTVTELGAGSHDLSALIIATLAAMTLGNEIRAHALAGLAVQEARAQADAAHLPVALELLAFSEFQRDHFSAATAHAQEGLQLADRAGQDNCVAALLAILALLSTVQGDRDDALLRAQVAARQADGRGLSRPGSLALWAAVRMALANGQADGAPAALRVVSESPAAPVTGPGRMHLTIKVLATPDLVEAAIRYGESEQVRAWVGRALDTFDSWATQMGSPAMLALLARCQALVDPDEDAADEWFRQALSLHGNRNLEFERARTQLLYGRALRRRRRPAKARDHLQEALDVFEALDARSWSLQARAELRAAGGGTGVPVRADPDVARHPQLTPQQGEIARLVAGGATNREIAAQLFLSPRTVDHHLRNIFVRLGIRSRVELTRVVS
jgi:DNA-binding CsgD family transcriptional regulator